jgi:hypothetical protein
MFRTRVTVYRKGRCWLHAARPGKNCTCPLQVVWQDVVPDRAVRGIARGFEAAGRVVATRVSEPA